MVIGGGQNTGLSRLFASMATLERQWSTTGVVARESLRRGMASRTAAMWTKSQRQLLGPTAGVRERQQFGGPTRTTGLGQADRKRLDPPSTLSCPSTHSMAVSKPVVHQRPCGLRCGRPRRFAHVRMRAPISQPAVVTCQLLHTASSSGSFRLRQRWRTPNQIAAREVHSHGGDQFVDELRRIRRQESLRIPADGQPSAQRRPSVD